MMTKTETKADYRHVTCVVLVSTKKLASIIVERLLDIVTRQIPHFSLNGEFEVYYKPSQEYPWAVVYRSDNEKEIALCEMLGSAYTAGAIRGR